MNYKEITLAISESAGINKDIFKLDFHEEKVIHHDDYKYYKPRISGNYYFSEYQYWEKIGSWKCVTLYINKEKISVFVDMLNSIFKNQEEVFINRENPNNFNYREDNFNVIVIKLENNRYRIDFAEKII